ncbi:MAG: MobA/MobL family protein, partial [Cyanobacteria bacterium J06614_10]
MQVIGRSAGRSATAAAAYRSGEQVADERTGKVHDYTGKSDIYGSEIL